MASSQSSTISGYDLTTRMSPFLDRHLVFPLLEFLQAHQMYPENEIIQAKIALLSKTNMVDYAMEMYKTLLNTEDVPSDMVTRRDALVQELRELEGEVAPYLQLFEDVETMKNLRQQKNFTIPYLEEHYDINPDRVERLYAYAKFQYDAGNYADAAEYLYHYRVLVSDAESTRTHSHVLVPEHNVAAMWGKLAAEILMQNWEGAQEDLNALKDYIDNKRYTKPSDQLLHRCWIIHWSLFLFFSHPQGKQSLVDLFSQERYISTIQTCCPHVLRYVVVAMIANKRRRFAVKDIVSIIETELENYSDPITQFVVALFKNFDFEEAQQKLLECDAVLSNDYLLVSSRDDFIENARLLIFETYCRIYQSIDVRMLGEKLNMSEDDAERWIVNLVRNAKLDAKIDSQTNTVVMGVHTPNVYQQVVEKTKWLQFRSFVLAGNLERRQSTQRGPNRGNPRGGQGRQQMSGKPSNKQ